MTNVTNLWKTPDPIEIDIELEDYEWISIKKEFEKAPPGFTMKFIFRLTPPVGDSEIVITAEVPVKMKVHMGNYPSRLGEEHRLIDIQIDEWDTWGLNTTLSYIIVPCLEQLRAKAHGAPYVENEDVPKELYHPFKNEEEAHLNDVDEHWFARWDWVLGEMIYAFTMYRDSEDFYWNEIERDRAKNGIRLFCEILGWTLGLMNEVEELRAKLEEAQARIDELMFEYCPQEMTQEQLDAWAIRQLRVDDKVFNEFWQYLTEF